MVPVAGQVGIQLSRTNLVMRRFGSAERASASIRWHCAALFLRAAAACFLVQRWGFSGGGHSRCGADFLSHFRRQLWRCAKMAAMVRLEAFRLGSWARQVRVSRRERMSWFMASLIA